MKLEINGAKIEDCSAEQVIMIIKQLSQKTETIGLQLPIIKPKVIRKQYAKRGFGEHHFWTEDELVYLIENMDKGTKELRNYFDNKYTISAINNMKWNIRNGRK